MEPMQQMLFSLYEVEYITHGHPHLLFIVRQRQIFLRNIYNRMELNPSSLHDSERTILAHFTINNLNVKNCFSYFRPKI